LDGIIKNLLELVVVFLVVTPKKRISPCVFREGMEKVRKKLGCAMPGVVGGTYQAQAPRPMGGNSICPAKAGVTATAGSNPRDSVEMVPAVVAVTTWFKNERRVSFESVSDGGVACNECFAETLCLGRTKELAEAAARKPRRLLIRS
jgi:hypothetical protein